MGDNTFVRMLNLLMDGNLTTSTWGCRGFIDLAHVRDTADNATGLFYKTYPKLGQAFTIALEPELGEREIHFQAFDTSHLTAAQKGV
ncbi:DUF4056 domain-containing protein [Vibrio algivorus]|uniref:Uncharacterized protein n=1 Tax=Vibrio algivorus TaxID=1667024 RepID=A0ABQ6ELJ4_9VIBR|nr:DUF4056 domain-containing protein [Vibrio algivorus]GLT13586.1 hypothetical protein GCM10007931_05600 [Vibrio algivorus]